ncbi:protelomerase [Salmonella enterica subsp. enterica serovar Omuna]|nr:protelomerase [Salmonella enterica subsp. enterica serovar Omuna]
MAKVQIGELIKKMVEEVDAVEASDRAQGDKTRRYAAIATKFKTALFTDKRKYRGEGIKKRITANTFNAYVSRARKRFDDRFHHHFEKNVTKLASKYPLYSTELLEWLSLPAADVRQRLAALQQRLKMVMPLAEELSSIKLGSPGSQKKLQRLAQKYPSWQLTLTELAGPEWNSARDEIYQSFQQGERLLDELSQLKINHEILYHLQLSPAERQSIQQRWADVLSEKKRSTVSIDYPQYMQSVHDLLSAPLTHYNLSTRVGMAPLAFALSAVSGRRMIEILWLGEFRVTGRYTVEFTGQAKKRSESDSTARTIYTLCEAQLFVDRLNALRACPAAADFAEITEGYGELDTRSENARIKDVAAKAFNPWVKDFFGDERRVFKDSRAIYARIAYELWFRHDPRWQNVDEDVFFSEILGHDDENTQLHYKQFKLLNFTRSWKPVTGVENRRLANLQALDSEMPEFAKGDAGVRIHNTVKELIEVNPNEKITNSTLRKYGFNSPLIRRYLAFAADALEQFVGENGQYQLHDEKPQIVIRSADDVDTDDEVEDDSTEPDDEALESDEIDVGDDIQSADPEPTLKKSKPRLTPQYQSDGSWIVAITADDREFTWRGDADSSASAMGLAWNAFCAPVEQIKNEPSDEPAAVTTAAEMPRPRLQLVDGWWTSTIEVDGKTLVYIEMEGSRDEVIAATKEAWANL